MPRVRFTHEARADLADIAAFSVERFGKARMRLYVLGLQTACRRLGDFPNMAPFHPRIEPPVRVFPHRSHRIFYRVDERGVRIVRVLHHARDTPNAL